MLEKGSYIQLSVNVSVYDNKHNFIRTCRIVTTWCLVSSPGVDAPQHSGYTLSVMTQNFIETQMLNKKF